MDRKQILIVEDNADSRTIYRAILQTAGYRVLVATDGAEGVRLASENPPDLILMDLALPIVDGWQALELLRQNPRTARVPVCALSALALDEEEQQAAIDAGFACFLPKPLGPREILAEVQGRIGPAVYVPARASVI